MINPTTSLSGVTYFPTLYKRTSAGAVQFWKVCVIADDNHGVAYNVWTDYGQVDTENPQVAVDRISEGKNKGRANETSVFEQAVAEARSKWEKQKKKGYVEDLEKAKTGQDDIGGILPMLAHQYDEYAHKITWPAIVQPKLDGMRCIAVVNGYGVRLYSRTRKLITSMKHIEHELFEIWKATGQDMVLDGELYNHDLKHDFESIISAARKEEYVPETAQKIKYYVYDMVSAEPASGRQVSLDSLFMDVPPAAGSDYLVRVATALAISERDMRALYDSFVEQGYEGAIVRRMDSAYEHKRSYSLQKVKEFQDSEFLIVDVHEGRGRMAGHGIFVCKMDGEGQFYCKMAGPTEHLKDVLINKDKYIGKMLTVQYQGMSNKNHVPRFPVGLRIREEE